MAVSPIPYSQGQFILGHYAVAQKSGATVNIAAGGILGSIRWTQTNSYLVLMRIKAGWCVTGAVTAATPMDLQAVIVRGFTVDFTTASTAINMATVAQTNQMRDVMSLSKMGANGPRISTTAVMSGQTATADSAPFAMTVWNNQPSGNATVTQAIGVAGPMQTVYEWTGLGQHPVVLGNNEGVFLETVTAAVTSGTIAYYFMWEWAEVAAF